MDDDTNDKPCPRPERGRRALRPILTAYGPLAVSVARFLWEVCGPGTDEP